jgi:6-phosphogluconolactonase/glucosamine-6-phosphate isomerase/deaminase
MHVIVTADHEHLSRLTADILVSELMQRTSPLFGCIAGRTPRRAYELFVSRVNAERIPVEGLRHVLLNEWCGLGPDDPASFAGDVARSLLDPLQVPASQRFCFDGLAADCYDECARVRHELSGQGPIDLMILGIGANGHVAFNEPGPSLSPTAHLAELADTTKAQHLPGKLAAELEQGMTLGFADIMSARRVVLLASGERKGEVVSRLMRQDVCTDFPASLLWAHPRAVFICDQAAFGSCSVPRSGRFTSL